MEGCRWSGGVDSLGVLMVVVGGFVDGGVCVWRGGGGGDGYRWWWLGWWWLRGGCRW